MPSLKDKIRDKVAQRMYGNNYNNLGIAYRGTIDPYVTDSLQTFSAELDKLINKHKAINSELHGREDCKSCSLLEDLEQARKELGK